VRSTNEKKKIIDRRNGWKEVKMDRSQDGTDKIDGKKSRWTEEMDGKKSRWNRKNGWQEVKMDRKMDGKKSRWTGKMDGKKSIWSDQCCVCEYNFFHLHKL
jgi:hypothetical protein